MPQSAVNLAVALARNAGLSVGLMDADVYGPSIPRMMNLAGEPRTDESMPHTLLYSLTPSLTLALQHPFAHCQAWQDRQQHPFTAQVEAQKLMLCRWKALPPAELWREVHVNGLPYEGAQLGNMQKSADNCPHCRAARSSFCFDKGLWWCLCAALLVSALPESGFKAFFEMLRGASAGLERDCKVDSARRRMCRLTVRCCSSIRL